MDWTGIVMRIIGLVLLAVLMLVFGTENGILFCASFCFVLTFFLCVVVSKGKAERVGWLICLLAVCWLIAYFYSSSIYGKPIPFDKLKQNKVYQVAAIAPEINLAVIRDENGKDLIVKIPESSKINLEKEERFVRIKDKIAKLYP